ncbi:MAG: membrane protein insertion efficiency factor YidD [Syntrophales bacterium LBB04]|nr:membrane protein insertion efficiency factor YidD [Syntrophales bacterium LBB04]
MDRRSGIFQTKMALIIIVPIIMSVIGLAVPCYCMDEKSFAPWEYNNPASDREVTLAQETDASVCGSFLIQAIRFYQHYISPVIGDRCQMYPSCSSYAVEAIKKHGCLIGSVMTSDRLIHEANEADHAPVIEKDGHIRYYDPVGGNDFWWYKCSDRTASQPVSR